MERIRTTRVSKWSTKVQDIIGLIDVKVFESAVGKPLAYARGSDTQRSC
jgi:hypothetical protein